MMQQDPKKDIKKPSVKEKLARSSAKKKEVGEMGKPSLKAEFEADMQKERDFVLNRAKQREEAEMGSKEKMIRMASRDKKGALLNSKGAKLKSMSKKSSIFEKITDAIPPLYGFELKNKNN